MSADLHTPPPYAWLPKAAPTDAPVPPPTTRERRDALVERLALMRRPESRASWLDEEIADVVALIRLLDRKLARQG